MATKLIIVEGLPGAGKSTTAQHVSAILNAKGIDTELYSEGNFNHPVDFDGVAYFDSEEFNILDKMHLLNKIKIKYLNGYLIPYRKAIEEQLITIDNVLLNVMIKKDIYELPIELHMELLLNRWNDFAKSCVNDDKVVLCKIQ
jgi:Cdc6-like AAA superfamily ATPase